MQKILITDKNLLEGYIKLLDNLNSTVKLDIISKLSLSIKKGSAKKNKSIHKAFGAWVSNQSAEEIVKEIRSSRKFNRQIESF